jgi:TPR repeat protein
LRNFYSPLRYVYEASFSSLLSFTVSWIASDACRIGNAGAQGALGVGYERGALGLEKDEEKAVEWYTKAAEQGHRGSQYQLGLCFERAIGTTRDTAQAAKWYKLAAEQGHAGGDLLFYFRT